MRTDRWGESDCGENVGYALVTDVTEALSLALADLGIAYVIEPPARNYLREGPEMAIASNSDRA